MSDINKATYITDNKDLPIDEQRALVISHGGNGDWYVQVTGINGFSMESVRLCTSGGASTNAPGLTGAIAEAYRCIKAFETKEERKPLLAESYCKLKAEVDAWRQKFPNIQFMDEVSGFTEKSDLSI